MTETIPVDINILRELRDHLKPGDNANNWQWRMHEYLSQAVPLTAKERVAETRAIHARANTMIPFPGFFTPRDSLAKFLSRGLNLWTDWYDEADEIISYLDGDGFKIVSQSLVEAPKDPRPILVEIGEDIRCGHVMEARIDPKTGAIGPFLRATAWLGNPSAMLFQTAKRDFTKGELCELEITYG